jgi:nucleoid-associated protein YgaU
MSVSAVTPGSNTPTREYTVKNGDSCWKIAANELGDGSRYTEIIKLNGLPENPKLDIGMKLKIPAK